MIFSGTPKQQRARSYNLAAGSVRGVGTCLNFWMMHLPHRNQDLEFEFKKALGQLKYLEGSIRDRHKRLIREGK